MVSSGFEDRCCALDSREKNIFLDILATNQINISHSEQNVELNIPFEDERATGVQNRVKSVGLDYIIKGPRCSNILNDGKLEATSVGSLGEYLLQMGCLGFGSNGCRYRMSVLKE